MRQGQPELKAKSRTGGSAVKVETMRRKLQAALKTFAVGATLSMGAACADLDISNTNEPDRDRALADALAVESLIAGSFQTWWDVSQGNAPGRFLAQAGDTHTSASLNHGTWDVGFEPRKPIINQPGYQWGYPIEDPWNFLNRANAAIRDGLVMIEGGLEIGTDGADTPRLRAFGKFMLGMNHAFLAMLYDKGWIVDETIDTQARVAERDMRSHTEIMAAARGYLAEARQIASQNSFTIPPGWMGSRAYSSAELIRITHSYEARFMTAVARSKEERAAVNWNDVLTHIQAGVTEDFGVLIDGPGGLWTKGAGLKAASSLNGGINLRLVGPADQSGAYQTWESTEARDRQWFLVETDDRRIHAEGNNRASGSLFQLQIQNNQMVVHEDAQRGLWYQTPYSTFAWRTIAEDDVGFAPDLTVEEMDFLRAEAYIRLNRAAEALPIINKTRVENGHLPPATLTGVSGSRCVPRSKTGACGDLMAALIYEKRLETLYLSAGLDYFDARGFGILVPGTFIHLPVPALELTALQIPAYTFGGDAGGSSP
jgi:hypothetical protein